MIRIRNLILLWLGRETWKWRPQRGGSVKRARADVRAQPSDPVGNSLEERTQGERGTRRASAVWRWPSCQRSQRCDPRNSRGTCDAFSWPPATSYGLDVITVTRAGSRPATVDRVRRLSDRVVEELALGVYAAQAGASEIEAQGRWAPIAVGYGAAWVAVTP